jgi:hypothetical protein
MIIKIVLKKILMPIFDCKKNSKNELFLITVLELKFFFYVNLYMKFKRTGLFLGVNGQFFIFSLDKKVF